MNFEEIVKDDIIKEKVLAVDFIVRYFDLIFEDDRQQG